MAKDDRDPPEDIPPVHVLEAMHAQEKKETEELLSGFDRPGRTPRKLPPQRDFVDYYARKDAPGRPPPASLPRVSAPTEERATLVLRRRRSLGTVIVWAAAASGMVLLGAIVAILATPDPPEPRALPTMLPSSATTITSGSAAPSETEAPHETSETATPTVIVAAPPPSPARPARSAPATTAGSSASTGAATTIKTAPRDDFIRDL